MVEDLRDNVKVLKAELKEANGRAAALEDNIVRQQVSQASGADKRKVVNHDSSGLPVTSMHLHGAALWQSAMFIGSSSSFGMCHAHMTFACHGRQLPLWDSDTGKAWRRTQSSGQVHMIKMPP